jgi:hypothetical protein
VCPVPDPTYAKSDDLFASSYALRQASGYEFDPGLIALPLASSDPNAQPVIVRRSLAASESPGAPGNTMTDVDSPYLHTTFPAFCFDSGLIT